MGPGEIAVVQRGIKWKVALPDGSARGCMSMFRLHYEVLGYSDTTMPA